MIWRLSNNCLFSAIQKEVRLSQAKMPSTFRGLMTVRIIKLYLLYYQH